MKNVLTRLSAGFVFAAAFAASANAEYRCDPSPTVYDRLACEAAQQGPTALRRFVRTMDQQDVEPVFRDYVDDRTVQSWETKKLAESKESGDKALKRCQQRTALIFCGTDARVPCGRGTVPQNSWLILRVAVCNGHVL